MTELNFFYSNNIPFENTYTSSVLKIIKDPPYIILGVIFDQSFYDNNILDRLNNSTKKQIRVEEGGGKLTIWGLFDECYIIISNITNEILQDINNKNVKVCICEPNSGNSLIAFTV